MREGQCTAHTLAIHCGALDGGVMVIGSIRPAAFKARR